MIIKYEKIMQDILKDFNKGAKCKTHYMIDNTDDTYIYICFDGHYILSIPRCVWLLDTEKILNQGACSDHNHCFTSLNITNMIKNTNMLDTKNYSFGLHTSVDKKKVAVFVTEEGGDDIWINDDFFKYLNIDLYNIEKDVIFSGSTKKAPLIVHDRNYFVGILLPINHD